mmetsp:Transcript_6213/g.13017  ORF Transcript_6213/g.13017 Transcript_6213/m.13017 type:complete len:225 (-) Transcript_6213:279-953(-)
MGLKRPGRRCHVGGNQSVPRKDPFSGQAPEKAVQVGTGIRFRKRAQQGGGRDGHFSLSRRQRNAGRRAHEADPDAGGEMHQFNESRVQRVRDDADRPRRVETDRGKDNVRQLEGNFSHYEQRQKELPLDLRFENSPQQHDQQYFAQDSGKSCGRSGCPDARCGWVCQRNERYERLHGGRRRPDDTPCGPLSPGNYQGDGADACGRDWYKDPSAEDIFGRVSFCR